jgi:menaquinone-specific isochorismate synthase
MSKNISSFNYTINEKKLRIHCLETTIELKTHPLQWLQEKTTYPKVFWKSKIDSKTTLAFGSVISFKETPNIKAECIEKKPLRFFSALPFSHDPTSWEGFSLPVFFLPRITLTPTNDREGLLSYYYLEEEKGLRLEDFLENEESLLRVYDSSFLDRIDLPNRELWYHLVEKALHAFETTPLQKVVLARASHLTFAKTLSPLSVVEYLSTTATNCTLFAYLPSEELSFIGASPEHLYTRIGNTLFTEAIAGTRPRGKTEEEDLRLIKELYENAKEQQEFDYVDRFLEETLSTLCVSVTKRAKTSIIQTKTLQHLYHLFEGILHPSITDKKLLEILHPTPAIGGSPKHLAGRFLQEFEPFTRGLYASPLGWISSTSSEYIVAIRSALIKKNTMTLFAGAGIVKNSDPIREWEELELKISPFLNTKLSYATK